MENIVHGLLHATEQTCQTVCGELWLTNYVPINHNIPIDYLWHKPTKHEGLNVLLCLLDEEDNNICKVNHEIMHVVFGKQVAI
jgi:hypothetical protein